METLGSYLLQMACWLAGFWLVYVAVLRKETFFELNRWFLLFGLVASLTLPFFPIRYNVIKTPTDLSALQLLGKATGSDTTGPVSTINLWMIAYLLGILIFLFRFVWQAVMLHKLRSHSEQVTLSSTRIYKLDKDTAPFSFFNSIYISKNLCGETELKTVVAHEKVHIDERHWVDLLLLEVTRALQWFNPLLILYRKAMMQNHEFLADNGTLQKGVSAHTYKAILANQMLGVPVLQVANGFTLFNPTKRILMMNKDKTTPIKRFKLLWALPIIALLLAGFAKPNYVSGENSSATTVTSEKTVSIKGKVTDTNGKPLQGTTIVVKNSTTGTISDDKGNYSLAGIDKDAELVFSYVGYETLVSKVKSELNVSMKHTVIAVAPYGGTLAPPPPPPPVDIRSIDGGKTPLIVVDGVIKDIKADQIDPNTIQSINVIKNEDAVKKFGGKAKDGVIEITTKKEMTPPQVNLPIYDKSFSVNGQSLTIDKDALVIVNGKKTNIDINTIDPNTIQSIIVLKGKSAVDKYGQEAAIEITLKKNTDLNSASKEPVKGPEINGNGNEQEKQSFVIVEQPPLYPGGGDALSAYLVKGTAGSSEKGTVKINFTVTEGGKIKDAKVVKGVSDNLDKKALEIIYGMPKWEPATQHGKAVEVVMSMEVKF